MKKQIDYKFKLGFMETHVVTIQTARVTFTRLSNTALYNASALVITPPVANSFVVGVKINTFNVVEVDKVLIPSEAFPVYTEYSSSSPFAGYIKPYTRATKSTTFRLNIPNVAIPTGSTSAYCTADLTYSYIYVTCTKYRHCYFPNTNKDFNDRFKVSLGLDPNLLDSDYKPAVQYSLYTEAGHIDIYFNFTSDIQMKVAIIGWIDDSDGNTTVVNSKYSVVSGDTINIWMTEQLGVSSYYLMLYIISEVNEQKYAPVMVELQG